MFSEILPDGVRWADGTEQRADVILWCTGFRSSLDHLAPLLLRELIRNLVDNALQYTPAGGTVTVRIVDDPFGQVVVLQVEDSGPGIPPTERAERELLFRLLVENASDVVTIYGPDAGFRYVSPSIGRVLGYRPEEAIRLGNAGGIIHPDEAGDVARRFEEIWAAPGVSLPVAFRMRHKDGSWRHMEGVLNNLLSDPEVGGVVASWRDVTARIEAEKEVRRLNAMLERRIIARTAELEETLGELASSEERYRALFENAVEGIFQTDAEGRLTTANPAMARIFGHESPGSLIAATKGPVATLYADEEKAREVSATLVNEGKVSASEARATRRDGSEVWISVSARAVREGPGGEILRYEGTVQDISERVGARRTLEKRVAALTRLAGNLTAGQPVATQLGHGEMRPHPAARAHRADASWRCRQHAACGCRRRCARSRHHRPRREIPAAIGAGAAKFPGRAGGARSSASDRRQMCAASPFFLLPH